MYCPIMSQSSTQKLSCCATEQYPSFRMEEHGNEATVIIMSQTSIRIQDANLLDDAILPAITSRHDEHVEVHKAQHGLCTLEKTLTKSY